MFDGMYEIARRQHREELERIRLDRLVRDARLLDRRRGRRWGLARIRRR
jgi:hypothetical protein